ncbi:MAG: thiamine pyrophosphate-dependent enzyme, partial [Thermoanaerobaculia bacterium]
TTEGRLMPQHCSIRELNIFPGVTAMGAECLPAAGTAWGIKKAGGPGVVICTIGDASTRQGEFYEALCFAVQEQLPIVFVLEDNGYGISTPTRSMLPFRLDVFHPDLAVRVDGRNVFELFERSGEVIARARRGEGPTVLWCELDRLGSHTSADDHRVYRSAEDIAAMEARDPIRRFADRLQADGELSAPQLREMQQEVARTVDRIYREVEDKPAPDPARVLDHLFGPPVEHPPLPFQLEGEAVTMVEAINRTLHAGMELDPRMLCFGQDIEDPKGGVFGLTAGLSSAFPGRVENSPLAEATIVGTAVGLAASGYRPVFEVQFIDYLTPGFHQLVTQIATLRWRSCGAWTCPLVLYAPYGAYLPGGGHWHSQSNDGWWAHIPGLRVAVPSTPEDAAGLFWSAFHDQDPSLILIPKHLLRQRTPVQELEPVPFGRLALRRAGGDVTVVSWGNCLELAEQAARRLEPEGVSLEILDLRTLVPCDWPAIKASLSKTGRLVVIHEDNRTCGFGQAVIAEMMAEREGFELFFAPPQLVARADVHIPYHPDLEYAVLPSVEGVVEAVRRTLEGS